MFIFEDKSIKSFSLFSIIFFHSWCSFSVPLVPENFTFSVHDVKTTEAVFTWSDMDIRLKPGFALIIKYYFDQWKPYILSLPVNTTQIKVVQLSSGLCYSFLLAARNQEGAQTILSPILKVETSKSQKEIAVITR